MKQKAFFITLNNFFEGKSQLQIENISTIGNVVFASYSDELIKLR